MSGRKIDGLTITVNSEHIDKDGCHRCNKCNTKTLLVSTLRKWDVDEEAFGDGIPNPEGTQEHVYVGEVSGHFCPKCDILVSLTYNFD